MKVAMRILFLAVIGLVCYLPTTVIAADNVIKIKLADQYPVGHTCYKQALFFQKRVPELTKGKVVIEYYPSEQLGKLRDLLRVCSSGITDIANVGPNFFVGQLPLSTLAAGPFYSTATEGSAIMTRFVLETPELQQEYGKYGLIPLMGYATCQYDIGTMKKQVKTPKDVRGLKIRTPGGFFDKIAKRYGINPVTIASPEIYEAAQRGVFDGLMLSYASVRGYRTNELTKYHTYGLKLGANVNTWIFNEKKWQSLPNEIKDALYRAGKEASVWYGEAWDKEQQELADQYEKEGMIITRFSKDMVNELKEWNDPMKGIDEDWVKDMEGKGLPARPVLARFQKICNEIVK